MLTAPPAPRLREFVNRVSAMLTAACPKARTLPPSAEEKQSEKDELLMESTESSTSSAAFSDSAGLQATCDEAMATPVHPTPPTQTMEPLPVRRRLPPSPPTRDTEHG
jgi:hypothetical protein